MCLSVHLELGSLLKLMLFAEAEEANPRIKLAGKAMHGETSNSLQTIPAVESLLCVGSRAVSGARCTSIFGERWQREGSGRSARFGEVVADCVSVINHYI